ncbi:MAG: hypothetical protein ASARMPRED_002329 [Alectoria sarmentosa]|nr:MAG: hypothetical protein ASARMPRED_002329 [Alectoria sarmentosa]
MGKVHGSLARAGKVKSQTPKVPYRSVHCPSASPSKALRLRERDPIHSYMSYRMISPAYIHMMGRRMSADESGRGRPKGRAKKRITYTRRFVNVTMTGGKRKMNPNPTA